MDDRVASLLPDTGREVLFAQVVADGYKVSRIARYAPLHRAIERSGDRMHLRAEGVAVNPIDNDGNTLFVSRHTAEDTRLGAVGVDDIVRPAAYQSPKRRQSDRIARSRIAPKGRNASYRNGAGDHQFFDSIALFLFAADRQLDVPAPLGKTVNAVDRVFRRAAVCQTGDDVKYRGSVPHRRLPPLSDDHVVPSRISTDTGTDACGLLGVAAAHRTGPTFCSVRASRGARVLGPPNTADHQYRKVI